MNILRKILGRYTPPQDALMALLGTMCIGYAIISIDKIDTIFIIIIGALLLYASGYYYRKDKNNDS